MLSHSYKKSKCLNHKSNNWETTEAHKLTQQKMYSVPSWKGLSWSLKHALWFPIFNNKKQKFMVRATVMETKKIKTSDILNFLQTLLTEGGLPQEVPMYLLCPWIQSTWFDGDQQFFSASQQETEHYHPQSNTTD